MHIADGILRPEVCAVAGVLSLGAVGYSLHKLKASLAERMVPLTGMISALIFAGQMVNFPLPGTLVSGHLIGGVLAAVVLGPWAGCIAVTLVLLVQCALFADGGWLALGANVLHMAVIGSWGGYAVYSVLRRLFGGGFRGIVMGTVAASWLSVMAAAALFCLEFWASIGLDAGLSAELTSSAGGFDLTRLFTLMVALHSLIGIGEALITGVVVRFVLAHRPDLIHEPVPSSGFSSKTVQSLGRVATAGAVCALAVAAFLAPFASGHPDGLEAVAGRIGFDRLQTDPSVLLFDDYQIPLPVQGWEQSAMWQKLSVSLAGVLGTVAVLLIAAVLGRTLRTSSPPVARSSHVE